MFRQYGFIFHVLSKNLEQLQHVCELLSKPSNKKLQDPGIGSSLASNAASVREIARQLDLKASLAQAERITALYDKRDYSALKQAVGELSSRIQDELQNEWFLYIRADLLNYYTGKNLFGDGVDSKFPSTKEYIENAGKCIGVGQDTAAVFHIMRAMEAAVAELSRKLSITNTEREWGKLLSDIHKKIEQMPRGSERNAWSECHANLYHVKQAWRNQTMHPKATYTQEQAKEIFQTARVFMSQLATLI